MKFWRLHCSSSISLTAAFVIGVVAAQQFPSLPPFWLIALGFAAPVLLWLGRFELPAVLLLGLLWALAFACIRQQGILSRELEGQDMVVEGTVLDIPDALDDGLRFDFQPSLALEPNRAVLPEHCRLSWYRDAPPVKAGERWRLRIRLKRPHGQLNPGGVDYELWLFSQGIGATGYVRDDAENRKLEDASPFSMGSFRQAAFDDLTQAMAGSRMAGVVIALTIGAENAISREQWDVLRRTGTAHLVAISGSHISLVAGLVFLAMRAVCAGLMIQRWPPQAVAAGAAFLAALFYAALAGFAVPTQRASIMIAVVMAGVATQRNVRPLPTLALALLAVTVCDPLAVMSAGFWLSFGAVALILLAIAGRLRHAGWWRELWTINWATSLGLAPLLLFFFQQVSLVSPLANLVAVPTMGVVLTPLCLLGAILLGVHSSMGGYLLRLDAIILEWIWSFLEQLAGLSWAQWNHAAPPAWAILLAAAGVMVLLLPPGIPARWLGVVLLVPALTTAPDLPESGHFRLTLLDVGQGLAATVQTRSHNLVFDTGPRTSKSYDAGSAVVDPFLRQQGLDRIDVLVVSHGDNDHIGGAPALLQSFPVRQTYSSVPDRLAGANAQSCRAGQGWEWDGVRFDMLSPFGTLGNDNNNSCVLKITAPAGSALLTGDIESLAERMLVEHYREGLRADLLIAPHHGSKTSSTAEFLAEVRPEHVLIPAGYRNRYGFPHPEVLQRYRAIRAQVYDSASAGAIAVEPGSFPPRAYRQSHGKYWNARGE